MKNDATYSYHPHLGSASWITDHTGHPVQHLQYLPYGEPYINQHLSGYNERFTFTSKEPRKGSRTPLNKIKYSEHRDEETGYGYFGARYMDHELTTMWLSIDPMSDKYPSISPYAYCAWNPVKLVDPDGREIDLSNLSSSSQERLVKCLSKLTGLSLFVDESGKLGYAIDDNGNEILREEKGSESARADLMEAINKKNDDNSNYSIAVGYYKTNQGAKNDDGKGGFVRLTFGGKGETDCGTSGLGMVFLHELRHAVTGESDPKDDGINYYVGKLVNTRHMVTGSVVDRVNQYRRELNMPIRLQYFSLDGMVPFCHDKYLSQGANIIRENTKWYKFE